jgi:hypothetical protein
VPSLVHQYGQFGDIIVKVDRFVVTDVRIGGGSTEIDIRWQHIHNVVEVVWPGWIIVSDPVVNPSMDRVRVYIQGILAEGNRHASVGDPYTRSWLVVKFAATACRIL